MTSNTNIDTNKNSNIDIQFEKRFAKNLATNVVQFLISLLIGIIIVPFFLDTLGDIAYGFIPLATSLTSYVVIIIDAFSTSISRFLTIDLQRGDIKKSNETYNTAFFGSVGLILLSTPIIVFIAWFSPYILNIGEQAATSVSILFFLIFLSVMIRSCSSTFMTTLFAANRLDLRNYVHIANTTLQFAFIFIFFVIFSPSLEAVGLSYVLSSTFALFLSYWFSRETCPHLKMSIFKFSLTRGIEIGKLSFWVVFNSFGALLYTQVALFLANIICGEVANSEYAIAYTWFTLLYTIGSLLTNQFTPAIYSYYSAGNISGLVKFSKFATKCVGLTLALPIALVCIFSPQLLEIWVGSEYAYLSTLMCFIVIPVIIHIQASCIYPIYVSTNSVAIPALSNIVTGVIVIALSLLLTMVIDLGVYGIAMAVGIGMILRQGIFNPIYTSYILNVSKSLYFSPIWAGFAPLIVLLICGLFIRNAMPIINFGVVIILSLIISIVYLLILFKLIFSKEECRLVKHCLPKFIQRMVPSWLL